MALGCINKDKVKAALGTDQLPENEWDLVFKPEYTSKLKSCGISLWDSPSEIFPLVVKYIGKNPAESNLDDLKAAAEVLKKVRPDIKRFSPSFIDELARGDICVAVGNGGDMNMSKKRADEVKNGVNIEVLTPKGMGFWVESWLIPADAKNIVNAHKYMDWTLKPEIMIPLVGEIKELTYVHDIVVKTADRLIADAGVKLEYLVGTMIEIPRAALLAAEIAPEAEFFSFGTNDLTQMTFGFSRDDAGSFLDAYYGKKIYEQEPFARLDQHGVGKLVEMASKLGKQARPDIKLGVCGEHGGEPSSVKFCHRVGLNYVSCSPFRVPIARLAAAQAAIEG